MPWFQKSGGWENPDSAVKNYILHSAFTVALLPHSILNWAMEVVVDSRSVLYSHFYAYTMFEPFTMLWDLSFDGILHHKTAIGKASGELMVSSIRMPEIQLRTVSFLVFSLQIGCGRPVADPSPFSTLFDPPDSIRIIEMGQNKVIEICAFSSSACERWDS